MAVGATRGTTINRVRLLHGGRDPLAARLRVERILAGAAEAPGLPPAAILCVKRLRDPLPGSIRLTASQQPDPRWTRSVHDALTTLARRAVRPAREAVAGDPDAVIFDDRAQMLACLAADWCSGLAAGRWWWRVLLRDTDLRVVLRVWLDDREHIAAAVEELASRAAAVRFVRQLSTDDIRLLTQAVLATHHLAQLAEAIAPERRWRTHADGDAPITWPAGARVSAPHAPASAMVRAPWAEIAPEACGPLLRADQQLFLGIALTVRRRPGLARRAAFAAAAHAWSSTAARDAHRDDSGTANEDVAVAPPAGHAPAPEPPMTASPLTHVSGATGPAPALDAISDPRGITTATSSNPHASMPEPLPRRAGMRPAEVHTELGGLFYLLNVAIALGYYGDFTAPAYRDLDVSIWDFVTVVGGALVPDKDQDAIWALLGALAGREADEAPDRHAVRQVRRLVPAVRTRLAAALGTRNRTALARTVLRHRARVLSTATHIDVVFSLAELPIAIRMSGLDRDPDWIPAADRIVSFHFE